MYPFNMLNRHLLDEASTIIFMFCIHHSFAQTGRPQIAPKRNKYSIIYCGLGYVLSLFFLTGCQIHEINPTPMPLVTVTGNTDNPVYETASETPPEEAWWLQLGIEELDTLIEVALEQNWDTKQAFYRLEQAIAGTRSARSASWPELAFDAGWGISEGPEQTRTKVNELGADLSWDVDLFRRLSSTVARERFLAKASWWELQALRLTISAEVSQAYLDYLAESLLLNLLADQETAAMKYLSLVEVRFEQGLTTEIAVLQQRGQVAEIRSVIPLTIARQGIAMLRMDALLGELPGTWQPNISESLPPIREITASSPISPLSLLSQRPDLIQLQNEVASADADVGRALAERLPRLALSLESSWSDSRGAFNPINTLAAGLAGPIIDFGARQQKSLRAQAIVNARLAEFTQAYIEAVEDTQKISLQLSSQQDLLEILEQQSQLLERTLHQSQLRYQQGLTDYLAVLTTQQALYRLQQRILREKRLYFSHKVSQFRALGGPLPPQIKL
jgi:multidrug efflux system outer membrane protein